MSDPRLLPLTKVGVRLYRATSQAFDLCTQYSTLKLTRGEYLRLLMGMLTLARPSEEELQGIVRTVQKHTAEGKSRDSSNLTN